MVWKFCEIWNFMGQIMWDCISQCEIWHVWTSVVNLPICWFKKCSCQSLANRASIKTYGINRVLWLSLYAQIELQGHTAVFVNFLFMAEIDTRDIQNCHKAGPLSSSVMLFSPPIYQKVVAWLNWTCKGCIAPDDRGTFFFRPFFFLMFYLFVHWKYVNVTHLKHQCLGVDSEGVRGFNRTSFLTQNLIFNGNFG